MNAGDSFQATKGNTQQQTKKPQLNSNKTTSKNTTMKKQTSQIINGTNRPSATVSSTSMKAKSKQQRTTRKQMKSQKPNNTNNTSTTPATGSGSSMTPKRKKQSPLLKKMKVSKSMEAEQEFLVNVVRCLFIKKGVSLNWTAVSLLGDDMASTIGAPEPFERAVLELCLIIKADSTAKAALFLPLLGDDLHDYKRLYKALNKLGVYDHQVHHWRFPQFTFTAFDARPLIAILKKMPGRDASTGISKGCPYTDKFNSVLKLIRDGARCRIAKKNNWLFSDKIKLK